ncbi:MAG: nuclear transport factor 2 family protein [Rhodospirillales bacterium]|jgi:steroid delta-isomerase
MTDRDATLAAYGRYFETLTRETLPDIAGLATPGMRFRDPFNDVRGIDDVVRLLGSMYAHGTPRFEVLDRALGQSAGYILWRFTNDPGGGRAPWIIVGMSEVHFAPDGRISEHIDHWDAGGQFYAHIPVLGWLIRLVRRRLALR